MMVTYDEFENLPVLFRGESKDVRCLADDSSRVAIRFLPTVYSFTHNRCGRVEGTAELRVRSSEILTRVMRRAGVSHAYRECEGDMVIADRVDPPPIEVIVKNRHVGTPKHRYYGIEDFRTVDGDRIRAGEKYPQTVGPMVRFDWRNPLRHPDTNERLADEVLGEEMADLYIDVDSARVTARDTWKALYDALASVDIELVDICLFISADGGLVFGEISPDCARFRYKDRELDKDVWRKGGDDSLLLSRWSEFVSRIEGLV